MQSYDLVIVGGGPVALFAAFYAGRRHMHTLIVESSVLGGLPQTIYPEKNILDVPGFMEITGHDLSKLLIKQAQSEFLTTMTGVKIMCYEGNLQEGFTLHCTDGTLIYASSILLATGLGQITPRPLGLSDELRFKDKGLQYFLQSKEAMRGKKVVVVGGGDSALDWVDLLDGIAQEVRLVHRRSDFRAQEESVSRLKASSTIIHLNAEITAIHGDVHVSAVDIKSQDSTETIPCDEIVVAFGFKIHLEGLKDWGLHMEQGGIVVNQAMETNVPGIFAAGDVTYTPGVGSTKLLAVGFAQGTIAVNRAKALIDPRAKFFPGHSTAWKV